MSAKQASSELASQTKKFGKGDREIPHHSQKAQKYYPVEDENQHKKVRFIIFFSLLTIMSGFILKDYYKERGRYCANIHPPDQHM